MSKPETTQEERLFALRAAVRSYLNEYDNPVQDLTMKREALHRLRRELRSADER